MNKYYSIILISFFFIISCAPVITIDPVDPDDPTPLPSEGEPNPEPVADNPELVADMGTEPVADMGTEPVADTGTEPVADADTEPVADADTEPVADADTEPVADADTEPVADADTEPVADTGTEPVADADTEPVADAGTEPVAEAPVQSPIFQTCRLNLRSALWKCTKGDQMIDYLLDQQPDRIDDEGTENERKRICELFLVTGTEEASPTGELLAYAHWYKGHCTNELNDKLLTIQREGFKCEVIEALDPDKKSTELCPFYIPTN